MAKSNCTISFFRNDLQRTRLSDHCPVRNCYADLQKISFGKYQLPFCYEHGLRIHPSGFVYYNGPSGSDLEIATRRNLLFNGDYYILNFLRQHNKMESSRLCYENSEDAVSYNVFTELLSKKALRKLVNAIVKPEIHEDVSLCLWGNNINLINKTTKPYDSFMKVRKELEGDITRFNTEPDIILTIPGKLVICIEAKFGSKNPIAKEHKEEFGEKPKKRERLIKRYWENNRIISKDIFVFRDPSRVFYEQIFRNIVFAASMARIEGHNNWYVVNLRNQHVMNLKRGKPESYPIKRNILSMLNSKYKDRFIHLTWENIYELVVANNEDLSNLKWYLKNKSLSCGRAFNVLR